MSDPRTPEQMEWIRERFKPDGLLRLAHSTQDYYDSHGYYLPDVAALAYMDGAELSRLRDGLQRVLDEAPYLDGPEKELIRSLLAGDSGNTTPDTEEPA